MGCPTDDELGRLGDDALDVETFGLIERHVAECAGCQKRLERMAEEFGVKTTVSVGSLGDCDRPEIPGYEVGVEIGRGGSGVVYEAVQVAIRRRVAIKVLTARAGMDARAWERWLREARAVGRVRHANVVKLYDAGEHAGRLYLVLEMISGGSLQRYTGMPIDQRVAARLIGTMARAVEELHGGGILHLDIKPSNILLDGRVGAGLSEHEPLLSDFGISVESGGGERSETGTFGARGTPGFMAPEQIYGGRRWIGVGADVYGLGATLYTMLTGRPPFQGVTAAETFELVRFREPVSPRVMVPGLSRDLETICLRCLEKEPARRYGSAGELAEDLERWLGGRAILARPVSAIEHMMRWCRRQPMAAGLGGALAATVLGSLVGLAALWRGSEGHRARAEGALRRAVAGEASARDAVGDLVVILREAVEAPERLVSDRAAHAAPVVLGLTRKLRGGPAVLAGDMVEIAELELQLAAYLNRSGRFAESRELLGDAICLISERRVELRTDVRLASEWVKLHVDRGALSLTEFRYEESAADFGRAGEALEWHAGDMGVADGMVQLALAWRGLFASLLESGRRVEAMAADRLNREMIERLRARAPDDAMIELVAGLLGDGEMGAGSLPGPWFSAAIGRLSLETRLPRSLEVLWADQVAREVYELAEGMEWSGDDCGAAADRVLSAMVEKLGGWGLESAIGRLSMERLSQRGSVGAVAARRAGRMEDARRVLAWMAAVGRAGSVRDSGAVEPHIMISRAFEQEAKLGWAGSDLGVVERGLRAALEEASTALELDPDNELARQHLAGLREKYVRLGAKEAER